MLFAMMLLITIVGNKFSEYREEIAVRDQWIVSLEQTVAFKLQTITHLDAIINSLEQENKELRYERLEYNTKATPH
jgi:uncharacterized coiled-coil protein SlyX